MHVREMLTPFVLLVPLGATADVEDLVCDETGMAGVDFGEVIASSESGLEHSDSVFAYYSARPRIDIAPFTELVIGIDIETREVISIGFRVPIEAVEVDRIVSQFKGRLRSAYPSVFWELIGHQHYGEDIDGMEADIRRVIDVSAGDGEYLLSFDCLSAVYFGVSE